VYRPGRRQTALRIAVSPISSVIDPCPPPIRNAHEVSIFANDESIRPAANRNDVLGRIHNV
jgi:hypothetical protein